MFTSTLKCRLITIIFFSAVSFFVFSCKKSNPPTGGSFNYSVTDTSGVVHNFSDFSNLVGGLYYYNNGGAGSSQFPAGYISNHEGVHYFLFYDYTTPATNNITFSVPAYNQTITGTDSSSTSSLSINYTAAENGLNLVKPVSYTITTKMTDTTSILVSGSFTVTGTTASGKTISASGNFSGFGFF
jgi:hypothetical protein